MAFIGMRHVVGAPITEHTSGSEPTYGTGFDIGGAISGDLTITRNNNNLRYDDVVGETDNSITAMSIALGLDDLTEETQVLMGLLTKVTTGSGTSAVTTYYDSAAGSSSIGYGYMRVRKKNGVLSYQGIWAYDTVFSIDSENAKTMGESIEWQTPTVNGKSHGLYVDNSGIAKFRKRQNFDTADACEAWLDSLAGISRS